MTDLRRPLTNPTAALQFATAGNATLTLVSKATGARFTYKIREAESKSAYSKPLFFVSVLTGCDNDNGFSYFGTIREDRAGRLQFNIAKPQANRPGFDAPAVKAFAWFSGFLLNQRLPENAELWHEGKCGRCGRKLSVPESIATGFGPECSQRVCEAA